VHFSAGVSLHENHGLPSVFVPVFKLKLNSHLECSVFPRTRVVILTGAGKETDLSRKTTAVDEVISKLFTLAEIDETIQNLSGKALCA
jgi:hypothetical protein